MTFSSEEFISEEELEFAEEDYPSLFGITLNPRNSGILCGSIGLLAGVYILTSLIVPANKSNRELQDDVQAKEQQLENLKPDQIPEDRRVLDAKLQRAKSSSAQVVSLFSQTKSIDTLLLDINRFVKEKGATLISFKPVNLTPQTITDNSFGKAAKGKLAKQSFTLEIEGTFQQIQSIIRDIERLQFLVVVNNFTVTPSEDKTVFEFKRTKGKIQGIPVETRKLKTKFNVDILVPVSDKQTTP